MFGKDVKDDDIFRTAMQRYHFLSMKDFMGISIEEIEKNGQPVEVAAKSQNVLQEYFQAGIISSWMANSAFLYMIR